MVRHAIGEVEIAQPVVVGQGVLAGAEMVADRLADGLAERGQLAGVEAGKAEQTIHRLGGDGGQKLAARVGPAVFGGAGDVDGARGGQGDQLVLVDGQVVFVMAVFGKIAAEPVRKTAGDALDRLAVVAPAQRRAAAARVVGDDQRKPRILAPAHNAVLPIREWPITATRRASMAGSVSR